MTKHLVDIDEEALAAARRELGTATMKATVNEALRLAARTRTTRLDEAIQSLADGGLTDRGHAWR